MSQRLAKLRCPRAIAVRIERFTTGGRRDDSLAARVLALLRSLVTCDSLFVPGSSVRARLLTPRGTVGVETARSATSKASAIVTYAVTKFTGLRSFVPTLCDGLSSLAPIKLVGCRRSEGKSQNLIMGLCPSRAHKATPTTPGSTLVEAEQVTADSLHNPYEVFLPFVTVSIRILFELLVHFSNA